MRTIKSLFLFVLIMFTVFYSAQDTLADYGSSSGDASSLVTYPNAPGTKYEGPLTLYFTQEGGMYIFLRLKKGSALYPFSGYAAQVDSLDVANIESKVDEFIKSNVIPVLYRGITPPPKAFLKYVDQISFSNESVPAGEGCCSGLNFVILDVVYAVQD